MSFLRRNDITIVSNQNGSIYLFTCMDDHPRVLVLSITHVVVLDSEYP